MIDSDVTDELEAMQAIQAQLKKVLEPIFKDKGLEYALLIWTSNPPGLANFVTGADQKTLVRALTEITHRIDTGDLAIERDNMPQEPARRFPRLRRFFRRV